MGREYFKTFHSYLKSIEPLSDAERGRLFTAMLEYSITGEVPHLSGNEKYVFPTMQVNIDREISNYNDTLERNRENGKMGGRPSKRKNQNGFPDNPKNHSGFLKRQDKEEDKDKEKEEDKEEKEKTPTVSKRKFVAPTVDEVRAYCLARKNGIDAQSFVDFYEARGWMVGKNHMKDWRAAVRTWENHRKEVGRTIRAQEDGYGEDGTAAEDSERTFHGWRAKSALDDPD